VRREIVHDDDIAGRQFLDEDLFDIGKECGAIPVIPHKTNEKEKPKRFAKTIYKSRARIEQAVGKLKRFKRIALRCEKTKRNFASFVSLAAGFILVKSVHTA
jgi:transposase